MLFYGLSTLLKFSSLVQLRFTEPDVFRPYQVPLGNITLLSNLISIFLCFICSLFYMQNFKMGLLKMAQFISTYGIKKYCFWSNVTTIIHLL